MNTSTAFTWGIYKLGLTSDFIHLSCSTDLACSTDLVGYLLELNKTESPRGVPKSLTQVDTRSTSLRPVFSVRLELSPPSRTQKIMQSSRRCQQPLRPRRDGHSRMI